MVVVRDVLAGSIRYQSVGRDSLNSLVDIEFECATAANRLLRLLEREVVLGEESSQLDAALGSEGDGVFGDSNRIGWDEP